MLVFQSEHLAGGLSVTEPETTFSQIANLTSNNNTEQLTNTEVGITVTILTNVVAATSQNTSQATDQAIQVF